MRLIIATEKKANLGSASVAVATAFPSHGDAYQFANALNIIATDESITIHLPHSQENLGSASVAVATAFPSQAISHSWRQLL